MCDEISSIFDVRNTKVDVYWYLKLRGIFYDIADLLKAYKWALQYKKERNQNSDLKIKTTFQILSVCLQDFKLNYTFGILCAAYITHVTYAPWWYATFLRSTFWWPILLSTIYMNEIMLCHNAVLPNTFMGFMRFLWIIYAFI